jgi:hypothetical protein
MNRNWCGKWFRNLFQDETAPFRPNFKDDRFRSEIGSFRVRFNAKFCEPISSRLKCFWKVAYRFLWTSRGSLWFYRTSTTQFSTLVLFGTHIGSSSAYLLSKNANFCEPISSRLKCFWKVAYRFLWTPIDSLWFY